MTVGVARGVASEEHGGRVTVAGAELEIVLVGVAKVSAADARKAAQVEVGSVRVSFFWTPGKGASMLSGSKTEPQGLSPPAPG